MPANNVGRRPAWTPAARSKTQRFSTFCPPPWGRLAACAGLVGPLFGERSSLITGLSLSHQGRVWRPAAGVDACPTGFSSRFVGRGPILTGLESCPTSHAAWTTWGD
jgi:hypothetical protein